MNKSAAKTVKGLIETAKVGAFDATITFVTDLAVTATEAQALSMLDNLPPTVRAALSKLDQVIRNEIDTIQSSLTRNNNVPAPRTKRIKLVAANRNT